MFSLLFLNHIYLCNYTNFVSEIFCEDSNISVYNF